MITLTKVIVILIEIMTMIITLIPVIKVMVIKI